MTSIVKAKGLPCSIGTLNDDTAETVKDLFLAVKKGDKKKIRKCIEKGANVDVQNNLGQTPLMYSCFHNKIHSIEELLHFGANPNERSDDGYTAVHIACYIGNVGLLVKLLEAGGDLRLHDNLDRTPKDWATRQEFYKKRGEMLEFLDKTRYFAMSYCGKDNLNQRASLTQRPHVTNSLVKILKNRLSKTNLSADSHSSMGFGKVYCDSDMLPGMISLTPLVAEGSLAHDKHGPTFNNGVHFVMECMFWDKTPITVKRLHRLSVPGGDVDLLIHECEHIAKLRHPCILLLMGVCQTNHLDSMILMYERIEFGSLFYVLHVKKHDLLKDHIKTMVHQMVDALIFMHQQSFGHCALTSHAVSVVTDHQVKIGNLEYATQLIQDNKKCLAHVNKHKNSMYNWLSPEIMLNEAPQEQTDMFSLCVIMWEMFQAETPWSAFDADEIKTKVLSGVSVCDYTIKRIPPEYLTAIKSGLHVNYKDRIVTLSDLRELVVYGTAVPEVAAPSQSPIKIMVTRNNRSENNSSNDLWTSSGDSLEITTRVHKVNQEVSGNDLNHRAVEQSNSDVYSTPIRANMGTPSLTPLQTPKQTPSRTPPRLLSKEGIEDHEESLTRVYPNDIDEYLTHDPDLYLNAVRSPKKYTSSVHNDDYYPIQNEDQGGGYMDMSRELEGSKIDVESSQNLFESGFLSDKETSNCHYEDPAIVKSAPHMVSYGQSSTPRHDIGKESVHNVFSVLSSLRTHTSRVRFNESGNEIREMSYDHGDRDSSNQSDSLDGELSPQNFSYLRLQNDMPSCYKPASHWIRSVTDRPTTPNGTIYDLYNRCGNAHRTADFDSPGGGDMSPTPDAPSEDGKLCYKGGVKEIVQKIESSFSDLKRTSSSDSDTKPKPTYYKSKDPDYEEIPIKDYMSGACQDIRKHNRLFSSPEPSPELRSTKIASTIKDTEVDPVDDPDHARITKWVNNLVGRISRNMDKENVCTNVYLPSPSSLTTSMASDNSHPYLRRSVSSPPSYDWIADDDPNKPGISASVSEPDTRKDDLDVYQPLSASLTNLNSPEYRYNDRNRVDGDHNTSQPIPVHSSQARLCLPSFYASSQQRKSTPFPKRGKKWEYNLISHIDDRIQPLDDYQLHERPIGGDVGDNVHVDNDGFALPLPPPSTANNRRKRSGSKNSKRQLDMVDSSRSPPPQETGQFRLGREETIYIETSTSNPGEHIITRTTTDLATGDVKTHSSTKVFTEEVTTTLTVD